MTPLDMATRAAVAWAGTATVIGIGACALAEYQRRWKAYWANEAEELVALTNDALDQRDSFRRSSEYLYGRLVETENQRDAANKRWSRAMHLLHTAEKQNRALVDAQLAGVVGRLVE